MLSILSIAHNHRDITEFLLTTLARPECTDIPFELVFIDNGSTDDTLSLVKKFPLRVNPNFRGLTYHRFSKNQGVATGVNQAVKLARYPVLLQVDNDIVLGPGSLSGLMRWFQAFPEGLISPNWPWLQKKIKRTLFAGLEQITPENLAQLEKIAQRAPLVLNRATGSCWMCGRALFNQVKGWDSSFVNICASDDFQWKIALTGAPRLTVPCAIYHFGEITRRSIENNSAQQQKDLALFKTRWGGHPENDEWLNALLKKKAVTQFSVDATQLLQSWSTTAQSLERAAKTGKSGLRQTKPNRISAVVLTKNEENALPRLLKSLNWVDEIIVVDSHSTDQTVKIAKQFKAKVIVRTMTDFSSQWNAGLALATGDWVFTFDADEEVPLASVPLFQDAFRNAPSNVSGFRILRRNYALGRWLKHGQQYGKKVNWFDLVRLRRGYRPGDYIGGAVKLFRQSGARFENLVHEEVRVSGEVLQLQAYVNHYTADSILDMFDKVNFYTTLHAKQIQEKYPGLLPKLFYVKIIWVPVKTFMKAYFRKQGFLDGFPGLARCLSMMLYEFLKLIKLYDYYAAASKVRERNHP